MNVFLEIKGIKKHFGEGESRVEVLKGIDIEIEKGEICVLLGPSGSGKSTLLNIIGGIDAADEGYISINGEKTADMNEKALTLYRRKPDTIPIIIVMNRKRTMYFPISPFNSLGRRFIRGFLIFPLLTSQALRL